MILDLPPQIWLAGVALIVACYGIHLFATAWERVGDTPYCRKCRTDLSEVYDRCPKCKQSSQSYGVLRGRKKWQPGRFMVGLILTLISLGTVFYVFLSYDHDAA